MVAVQVLPPDPPPSAPADGGPAAELPATDFVDCYQAHYRRLVRALRLAGADASAAEDAAQDAFARALVHWGRVSRGPNPTGYVYTAGFRLLAKAQRRAARGYEGFAAAAPPDPTASSASSSVAIEAAIESMPRRRRECAVLCLLVGLPVRDAAEALGISDGTVRRHVAEARGQLASLLG